MATPWDRLVIPNIDYLVGVMNPSYFMDKLLAKDLINRPDYMVLKPKTPPEQVRQLFVELLPTKPTKAYEDFRQVLRDTKEQSHLLEKYFPPDLQPEIPSRHTHPGSSSLPLLSSSPPSSPVSGDRECTADDIRIIYRNVSSYWHKIGVELRLLQYELERIKSHEKDDDERCYSMLHTWLNKNFGRATIFSLFDAIHIVHCPLDAILHARFDSSLIEGWKVHVSRRL